MNAQQRREKIMTVRHYMDLVLDILDDLDIDTTTVVVCDLQEELDQAIYQLEEAAE